MVSNTLAKPPIRIANCSGFYGDRLSAAKEMVEGGPIDVLTGDYLAELTMAILFNKKRQSPDQGYVGTYVKQVKEVMQLCLEKKIKLVSNAGGLNPKGMADALQAVADELGLSPKIAWIDGDDLMPHLSALQKDGEDLVNIDTGRRLSESNAMSVTANAYLGCWGIKEALDQGADIVICPRVTDAAVVMGPAAWYYNWQREDYDQLAGSVAAGHVIECGTQATGGNYSFFREVPSFENMGFPLAEIFEDGSSIITKHKNTGGIVSVGTVKAQLLYEIGPPEYLNPDVTSHFDTLTLTQDGDDRVLISGCKGSAPPPSHKVCINTLGGFRNDAEFILTGLDIEEKALIVEKELFNNLGGKEQFDAVEVQLVRFDKPSPKTNEEAFAYLRVTVKSSNQNLVGRMFSAKLVELSLASIPGFNLTGMPGKGDPYIIYWPALVGSQHINEVVHFNDQTTAVVPTQCIEHEKPKVVASIIELPEISKQDMQSVPLGRIFGTRSGDKGGCANLGVWATSLEAYSFLSEYLSVDKLKQLLPDLSQYEIVRYELANIHALNFFVKDVLGQGVASSSRIDRQAKTLGEYLGVQSIEVPKSIV